jgi:transcription termination factor Rho
VSVLQRKELEESPLADLHAIASELGVEGYRALRKEDLVAAILGEQGEAPEPDDDPVDDIPEAESEPDAGNEEDAPPRSGRRPRRRGRRSEGRGEDADPGGEDPAEEPSGEPVGGVLDVLPNGSGFLRVEGAEDVYVSPAQIRRCELRAGDEVQGPMRPARRNERHPSLVHVGSVNGRDAEPPEERPRFEDLTPVHPTERLPAPAALEGVVYGKGSRVAIVGGPGAGATRLLRSILSELSGGELVVSVALAGVRPEEVTEWRREAAVPVVGGSFDRSSETQAQAAELAVERAKRAAERGADAVVVIDSLEALSAAAARRLFGAARKLEEGGSLTVIAATGMAWEPQRQASTRIALDEPADDGAPRVSQSRSGTLRADLLG